MDDTINNIMRIHAINSASDRLSCAQDLLHTAAELLAHGPGPHDTSSLDGVVHGDVAVVLDVLHLLLSLGGSLRALMMRAAAEGTTVQVACLFRPFQSPVALAMSSPTFLGERPRGPTFGARDEAAPTSPPTALRYMYLISLGSNLGPMVGC